MLGSFFYELRGIQRCKRRKKVEQKIEAFLEIKGQFTHREGPVAGFIRKTWAACMIYPAVLAP